MATKDDITRETTVRKAVDKAVGNAADDEAGVAQGGGATKACANGSAGAGAKAGANADAFGEGIREGSAPALPRNSVRDTPDDTLQDIRTHLAEHIETLQFVNGAISVCINALLQQNADMDADIALVLRHTAGDKLFEATERLELVALALEYGQVVKQCEDDDTAAA